MHEKKISRHIGKLKRSFSRGRKYKSKKLCKIVAKSIGPGQAVILISEWSIKIFFYMRFQDKLNTYHIRAIITRGLHTFHPLFNPIPTGLGHVTFIYGLIPPMAGRNRVKMGFRAVYQE